MTVEEFKQLFIERLRRADSIFSNCDPSTQFFKAWMSMNCTEPELIYMADWEARHGDEKAMQLLRDCQAEART